MRGFIYRLVFPDKKFYIGSTIQTLEDRLYRHRADSKVYKSNLYMHVNKIGWNDVNIELLEEVDINNLRDLHFIESEYFRLFYEDIDCLNTDNPYATIQEKREQWKKQAAIYRRNNPDKIIHRRLMYAEKKKNTS